ncbi:hypothetical protein E2K80_14660 [Rhodophyticola sp. CCM32]|uniref:hypothetical protein n=1 Tax=Rhodophyticola sp. CCM32 TaxID=2916397 RepID=UPI00107F0EC4|nr:hypothetical protein [Rhodophyticola sp. CCM32]QBY01812.1 hypothetical protein E2K80_14660 [Rhodophyticola sp. CCM32]
MKHKTSVISALAVLTAQAGIPTTALAQDAAGLEQACQGVMQIEDRAALQDELSALLGSDPNNQCITLIVSLLGEGPLAEVVDRTFPY